MNVLERIKSKYWSYRLLVKCRRNYDMIIGFYVTKTVAYLFVKIDPVYFRVLCLL